MLMVFLSQNVYKIPIITLLMNQHREWQTTYRVFLLLLIACIKRRQSHVAH